MLKHVTDADFDTEVLAQPLPVLVDFWAGWCGPCKAMAPTLEKLSGQYESVVGFAKINVDENPKASDRFGVSGLPTLALFKGGVEVGRLLGVQTRTKLCAFLDGYLDTAPAACTETDVIPGKTFDGKATVREACVARLEKYIGTPEAGDAYVQLLCVASGTDTPEDAAKVLGLPFALVPAVEILSTYYGTVSARNAFVLSWLKAVPVGADLTHLPRDLLLILLQCQVLSEALAGGADLSATGRKIVKLHREEAEPAAWAALRESIGNRISDLTGPLRAAAKCLQSACWPCDNPDMLVMTIRSAAFIPAARVSQEMGWTREDQQAADRLMKSCAETLIAETGSPVGAPDLMAREHPELAARFRRHSGCYQDALRTFGQFVGSELMKLTESSGA